jgi:hypothetical protein
MTEFFSKDHKHKHYMVTTKKEFEPIDPSIYQDIPELADADLYEMIEYAYLMCNSPCNDIKKVVVRKEISLNG